MKSWLLVGLGNPGDKYRGTRHNAGADLVDALCEQAGIVLKPESRFLGLTGRWQTAGVDCRLLIPTTYMNRSGQAVAALASYYRCAPENILVAHDELDFPPGKVRFKEAGGHGGHNGLRDISKAVGSSYARLRIGIGHPGSADQVTDYVLSRPSRVDRECIDNGIHEALRALPPYLCGDRVKATQQLHSST